MLTPVDIQNKTFEVKFRGYAADEVDNFMDMLANDYVTLYQENIALKDKVALLSSAVEQYKQMEETLQNSIILAQSTSETVKKNAEEKAVDTIKAAEEKAAAIIKEAELKGEGIIGSAKNELVGMKNQNAALKTEIESYRSRIKGICSGLLEMLDKME